MKRTIVGLALILLASPAAALERSPDNRAMTTRAGEVIRQRNAEIGNPATIEGAMGSDGAVAGALGAVMPAAVTGNADETLKGTLFVFRRRC